MVRPSRLSPLGFADDAKPICYVNGKRYSLPLSRGEATLLQWLRGELALPFCGSSTLSRTYYERLHDFGTT